VLNAKAGLMGTKLRKVTLSAVLAGLAAVLLAPAAEAHRPPPTSTPTTEPSYVPPPKYGQNPFPDPGPEPNPYGGDPGVAPTIVPVNLPGVITDPGTGGPTLAVTPANGPEVLAELDTRPEVDAPSRGGGVLGGVLSRTGAETMPLVRAGLAALALGVGLVVLARRRRADASV
jgi:hypothetical protein